MQISTANSMYCALLLLLIHLAQAQNTTCPSGTFQTPDGICKLCPPGTWRDARIQRNPVDRCILCPPGKFNPNPGAEGPDLCRRCPQLTFSSQRGSLKCDPCPNGTVSGAGASKCLVCKPGTEIRKNAKNGCVPCEKGFYNPDQNGRCRTCNEGQTSPIGATGVAQCIDCPPGEQSEIISLPSGGSIGTGCRSCFPGGFKPDRSGTCKGCPRGSISNEKHTACTPCPPGTFETLLGNSCKECFPDFETRGFGNYRCRRIGSSCPRAFFEDANGDCRECEKGFKFNIRANKCEKCPPGTVSIGGVQAVCERCPRGQKPDSEQAVCECPRGHRKARLGSCELCPKGQFSRLPNSATFCFDCEPGTFSDELGTRQCKPCPSGTVSSFGASKCTPCPPGTRNGSGFRSSECLSVTTDCQPGFRRSGMGLFRDCIRVVCKPDAGEEEIGKTCAFCDPDQFLNPKRKDCRECPRNSISFGGLVTECQKCPDGKVRDPLQASTCSCRATGKGLQGGKCKLCPPGSFGTFDSEVCYLCAPGKFADKPGSEQCMQCPIDTIAAEEGTVRCKKCPEETISNRRPRFFIDEEGGTKCIKIPA